MAQGIKFNILREDLQKAVDEGLSLRQLAAKFNIGWRTMIKRLNEHGIKTKYKNTPEYVKSLSHGVRRSRDLDPSIVDRIKTSTRRTFSTPDMKIKISEYSKAVGSRPEVKQNRSKITKSLWLDTEYKNKIVAAWGDQEKRLEASNRGKQLMQDPELRNRMALARQQTPLISRPHVKVCSVLDTLKIVYVNEYAIGPYNFDIFIPSHNLLIEVQGDYWHSLSNSVRNDKAKQTYVREYFPQYQLKYVWEHECAAADMVINKLKYWLNVNVDKIDFTFEQLGVALVDNHEADKFLYTWHYQHHGRHGLDVGCYINKELVAIARFTTPHRKEIATSIGLAVGNVLELSRFCIHPKYQKKNLGSWFLARAEAVILSERPKITHLVSFADATHNHTGALYKASNWTMERVVEPNYWYVNKELWVMHKKTLWNQARSAKMTESEFAELKGFNKVVGFEKYKFVKQIRE